MGVIAKVASSNIEVCPMWQRELLTRATMTMVEIRQERERKLSGQLAHKVSYPTPKPLTLTLTLTLTPTPTATPYPEPYPEPYPYPEP
jgi:hypothetical protein